jgi:hypothetical protein
VEPPAVQELGQPPLLTLLQTQSSHKSNMRYEVLTINATADSYFSGGYFSEGYLFMRKKTQSPISRGFFEGAKKFLLRPGQFCGQKRWGPPENLEKSTMRCFASLQKSLFIDVYRFWSYEKVWIRISVGNRKYAKNFEKKLRKDESAGVFNQFF